MSLTFDEMFRNPTPDTAEFIAKERNTGREELELLASGLMSLRGEQPDSPALPADGALRGDTPFSIPDKENR